MAFFIGMTSGLFAGMLGEYWIHRLQHWRVLKVAEHNLHHIENAPHGVLHEFWAYLRPAGIPILLITASVCYLHSTEAGIGWFLGIVGSTAFSAYTHELYHTDPNLVFWIKRPVHYFHHKHNQWKHNFAFTNTLLDRLFGTFKDDPTWQGTKVPVRKIFSVRWV